MTYSNDLKRAVVTNYNEKIQWNTIIKIFNISRGTLNNWIKKNINGTLFDKTKRKKQIDESLKLYIKNYIADNANFDYRELLNKIEKSHNVKISKSSLYNAIKEIGITKKKKTKKIIYLPLDEYNKKITTFKKSIKDIPLHDIISIDETSIDTHIDNNYGWSLKGTRIKSIIQKKRVRYSLLCAISNKNIIQANMKRNTINGEDFLKFIKEIGRKISQKKYLLVDNARIHHYKKLKKYIKKKRNLEIIYNVPYSPELNPIEQMFSELKGQLRKENIDENNIKEKITDCIKRLNLKNLKNYYQHSLG